MAVQVNVTKEDITRLVFEVKRLFNFDFSEYAEQSFKRRIEHVLVTYNINSVETLIRKLRDDKERNQKFINDITVNTTELFRDTDVWLNLRRNVLPKLKTKTNLNIWHAGCSSGEEVYSMLILLNEMDMLFNAKVFATDINTEIINRAKSGVFNSRLHHAYFDSFDKVVKTNPLNFEETIEVPYEKYFIIDNAKKSFVVKDFLRDKVTFKYHNLTEGSIFYKFDLILCRNVIIYFNTELQNKVVSLFHESLFQDGMLLIGAHENISYLPVGNKFETKIMKGLYFKK
ncbi:MAG: protein-glutamate O-methyltransferase CheR [Bacteroidetes bacterium]|nr:protein-glutamate O-methyltransferase CheR [Bacteroidota bacterium]